MIAISIVGILFVMLLPSTAPEEHVKLVGAAAGLATDIEYAQSATIARPDAPALIRFDADGGGYHLAVASAPDVPISRPTLVEDDDSGVPYQVRFGEGSASQLGGLTIDATSLGDDPRDLVFDAFGRLEHPDNLALPISGIAGTMVVEVRQTTGSVRIGSP